MTNPSDFVAGQLAQNASDVTSATPGSAVAAPAPGTGVTEADINAIREQLARLQAFAEQQAAAQRAATPDDITGSVQSLNNYLLHHADPVAKALGQDAAEAAKAVAAGGNTGALRAIVNKIEARLRHNPPYPGENFHYHGAVATASHLPEILDRADSQDTAPAKVVAGSVVG